MPLILSGKRKAAFFEQNIQSTISGTFVGMEKHLHRTGDLTEFMVIENDFKDAVIETATDLSYEEIAKLGKEKVLELVKYNSNIGLGGSGFPTYIKLETPNKIKTVLVNGAECEPYLTSDVDTMFAEADKIIYGLHFMIEFYGADKGIIGIKNKHKELIKGIKEDIDVLCKAIDNCKKVFQV